MPKKGKVLESKYKNSVNQAGHTDKFLPPRRQELSRPGSGSVQCVLVNLPTTSLNHSSGCKISVSPGQPAK